MDRVHLVVMLMPILFLLFLLLIALVNHVRFQFIVKFQKMHVTRAEPLVKTIEAFAKENNYSLLLADIITSSGISRLKKYLPRTIHWDKIQPAVPVLVVEPQKAQNYRPAFILRRVQEGKELRVFIFIPPKSNNYNHGVVYVTGSLPSTTHWFKLYPESYLGESRNDHDVESIAFNQKHYLDGSDRRLVTEVFDPLVIEHFNLKHKRNYIARVRKEIIEYAEEGDIDPKFLVNSIQTFRMLETKFLKAYQSYPEPVKK